MTNLLMNVIKEPKRRIVFVYPDVSVSQCCELMTENDIGALLVMDDYNLIGLVSERDIVRRAMCRGLDVDKATAADIAFADVAVLNMHDPVEKAMKVMTETRRRHVLLEENSEVVSILSIGDLLYFVLEDKSRTIEHLEKYINSDY